MDKKIAAERIRARLEKRLANFLGCDVGDLPRLKLGELVHLAFAIWGEEETLGGFQTTMSAVGQLVGRELLWGHRNAKDGRDGNAEGGHQLMREVTLDRMGKENSAAIQTLSLAQRKAIGELLLSELRKPVGSLRRGGSA